MGIINAGLWNPRVFLLNLQVNTGFEKSSKHGFPGVCSAPGSPWSRWRHDHLHIRGPRSHGKRCNFLAKVKDDSAMTKGHQKCSKVGLQLRLRKEQTEWTKQVWLGSKKTIQSCRERSVLLLALPMQSNMYISYIVPFSHTLTRCGSLPYAKVLRQSVSFHRRLKVRLPDHDSHHAPVNLSNSWWNR